MISKGAPLFNVMKIEIKKNTHYQCEYTITKADGTVENIALETKTYLIHDICHYAVEKTLGFKNGFWGTLSNGYLFNALFNKQDPQLAQLRAIETIVGPVQSVFSGHLPKNKFPDFIAHLDFKMTDAQLEQCLTEIENFNAEWRNLLPGQHLTLEW